MTKKVKNSIGVEDLLTKLRRNLIITKANRLGRNLCLSLPHVTVFKEKNLENRNNKDFANGGFKLKSLEIRKRIRNRDVFLS